MQDLLQFYKCKETKTSLILLELRTALNFIRIWLNNHVEIRQGK